MAFRALTWMWIILWKWKALLFAWLLFWIIMMAKWQWLPLLSSLFGHFGEHFNQMTQKCDKSRQYSHCYASLWVQTKQRRAYNRVWIQHIIDFLSSGALVFMCRRCIKSGIITVKRLIEWLHSCWGRVILYRRQCWEHSGTLRLNER